jgi:hypothetical protein
MEATALMLTGLDRKDLAVRAAMGFSAGFIGAYITRVLVRISEVWPVFHARSLPPLEVLLGQDWPLMLKACLAAGLIYGIFFTLVSRHIILGAVLLMNALVLVARVYMAGGFQLARLSNALPVEAFVRATVRAAAVLVVYWLLRALFAKRISGST